MRNRSPYVSRLIGALTLSAISLAPAPALGGPVTATFIDLPLGTAVNLTAEGPVDWVKWGLNAGGPGWTTVSKVGGVPLISRALTGLGTPPAGTNVLLIGIAAIPPGNVLNFNWSDGNAPAAGFSNTVVTETILPAQFDYPLGLGASFVVPASATTRVLDVFVQGFNADMLMTATMSGGGTASAAVAATKVPPGDPNNYSSGIFRVTFSGPGEVLTVSVRTTSPVRPGSVRFPNAGFFAATLKNAAPSTLAAPANFAAQPNGLAVNFTWGASPGASSYQLEAGSGPSLANVFNSDIGGGTSLSATGPAGTYFVRLRARAGATLSAPSNEVILTLGSPGPCVPPAAPTNVAFSKAGALLTLSWSPGAGATSYQLLAGTASGLSNAFAGNIGAATGVQFNLTGVPAGVYFARVVSVNACGSSGVSNEVAIPVP